MIATNAPRLCWRGAVVYHWRVGCRDPQNRDTINSPRASFYINRYRTWGDGPGKVLFICNDETRCKISAPAEEPPGRVPPVARYSHIPHHVPLLRSGYILHARDETRKETHLFVVPKGCP